MGYAAIAFTAFIASAVTLVSGFGLGTILLPVLTVFMPVTTAVALTAMIHLANNLFKFALVGGQADRALVFKFGLPAVLAAIPGAFLLHYVDHLTWAWTYSWGHRLYRIQPLGLTIGLLMVGFAITEFLPPSKKRAAPAHWLPLGGMLSGFLGGFSGHQGPLRAAFLIQFKERLTKESFIATNVVIAVVVDLARITVYGNTPIWSGVSKQPIVALTAAVAAFSGAYFGVKMMPKMTMRTVQWVVTTMLMVLGLAVATGKLG